MFKLIKILSIILVITFFLTCENTTEPNEDDNYFKDITETDENGNLIGNFDFDDWALPHRYFGNKIEIDPYTSFRFRTTYIGQEVISYILFINHYTRNYVLSFKNLNPPFNINRTTITFLPNQTDSLLIKFVLPDTSDFSYRDSLEITDELNEKIKFSLLGYWDNPNDSSGVVAQKYIRSNSFYPAYPNPATNSITFRYSIEKTDTVSLIIIDEQQNIIKTLVTRRSSAGIHSVLWNLKTDDDLKATPAIYRAILNIGNFQSHGDILIE